FGPKGFASCLVENPTYVRPCTDTFGFMVMWTLSDKKTNLLKDTNLFSGGGSLCKSDVCKVTQITLFLLNCWMTALNRLLSFQLSCVIWRLVVTRRIRSRLMLTICFTSSAFSPVRS